MNKNPQITRREQQAFIRENGDRILHFSVRACPCNGVGCFQCDGKMKYFDDPVPIYGAIINGMNKKKKEAQFPAIHMSTYKLLVEARYHTAEGDRLTPFGMREFETADEILSVAESKLTFIPINPRNVSISFITQDGVLDYNYGQDFTIEKELYGKVPLHSKQIIWITDPPDGQENFSVRYGYLPDFEIENIPDARMNQGQRLMQELPLKKITIGGQSKTKSLEKSSDAIRGVQAGLNWN